MVDVTIPDDLWDDDSEGSIAAWLFAAGDQVAPGDLIAEVMNEKTTYELLAPAGGKLVMVVAVDEPVTKGQLVARVDPAD